MSIKQQAENFLKKCRIIENNQSIEGIIVKLNFNTEFEVTELKRSKDGRWIENKIDEISIIDIIDEDDNKIVLNFKEIMFEIVGRKKYMLERSVYQFLIHDDTIFDDENVNEFVCFDDAKERAAFEAAEEEAAEHEFERLIRSQE